jgi:hypothetical protein
MGKNQDPGCLSRIRHTGLCVCAVKSVQVRERINRFDCLIITIITAPDSKILALLSGPSGSAICTDPDPSRFFWDLQSFKLSSVADPDPGSGAFLIPGSGIGKKSGSESGINNLDHISESSPGSGLEKIRIRDPVKTSWIRNIGFVPSSFAVITNRRYKIATYWFKLSCFP